MFSHCLSLPDGGQTWMNNAKKFVKLLLAVSRQSGHSSISHKRDIKPPERKYVLSLLKLIWVHSQVKWLGDFFPSKIQQKSLASLKVGSNWTDHRADYSRVCYTHSTLRWKDKTGADRLAFHTHLHQRMCLNSAPPVLMKNDSEDATPAEHFQLKGHWLLPVRNVWTLFPESSRENSGLMSSEAFENAKMRNVGQ